MGFYLGKNLKARGGNLISLEGKAVNIIELVNLNSLVREFKLRVIRQTANARQRKFLWYQAIKSK